MKRTGIFYHPICGEKAYFTLLMSVKEGFEILERENLFANLNVILFQSQPVPEELILKVHTREMIERVRRSGYYETALYSVGGVLQATEKVFKGEIENALVYIGVGGHHASRTNFWGGCFFNEMAIAIEVVRQELKAKRFAIIDTDTHHGDGTREIFRDDEDVLHICYCGWYFGNWSRSVNKTKICFNHAASDEEFVKRLEREVPPLVADFKPELVYWVCGLDTHRESYGTRKLTEKCYPKLAKVIKRSADEVCNGRLVVKAGCNAPASVSEYVYPRIVDILAELDKYKD